MDIEKIGSIDYDGGTSIWVSIGAKTEEDYRNREKYYLDNRNNSITKGELFDKYPSDQGAKMLNKNNFNFL